MTQEDKDLLIKDLCARIPYETLIVIDGMYNTHLDFNVISAFMYGGIYEVKPYLFPLSSMTGEQKNNLQVAVFQVDEEDELDTNTFLLVDWCNKNHFDYRGLIKKGLAIDCTNLGVY